MKCELYTNDTICTAMGIGTFLPQVAPVIRVLMKPSFHPEVCITFQPHVAQVVALESSCWGAPFPARMPEVSEIVGFDHKAFQIMAETHERIAVSERKERVFLDGMGVAIVHVRDNQNSVIEGNAGAEELAGIVRKMISLCYEAATLPQIKNALSDCGIYVDLKFSKHAVAESHSKRILMLGEAEDRSALMEVLKLHSRRPPKQ